MALEINTAATLDAYEGVRGQIDAAIAFGRAAASSVDRVFFVGCGGPNCTMQSVQYWVDHYSPSIETRRFFPAEFLASPPRRLDARTLVVLGSKSGSTPETVAAAEYLAGAACRTVAITQSPDSKLARAVPETFLMGKADGAPAAMFIIMQAMLGGLMAEKDGWDLIGKLRNSLKGLPQVMADTALLNDARAAEEARLYKDDRTLYHIAAGPMFSAAYVIGTCVLMEMQWMHSVPFEAAEFFHGPFEILDAATPFVLMKGEDPTRPLVERAERFCRKHTGRLMIYDTVDFPMHGIDPAIRPIVGPYVMQAALRRIAEHLAVLHDHPLATRRYMWKGEY